MAWQGKLDQYDNLLLQGKLREEHKEPFIGPFSYYVECFFELNTCRNGISLSPIPFTAIAEYAKIFRIEDFDEFLYYMRQLDNVFLEWAEKNEQASKKN